MTDYALHLQRLSKRYAGSSADALNALTLGVETGSMFGLIGANGAGKSTLIYAIAGLVNRTSGKMYCSMNEPWYPVWPARLRNQFSSGVSGQTQFARFTRALERGR